MFPFAYFTVLLTTTLGLSLTFISPFFYALAGTRRLPAAEAAAAVAEPL